MFKKIKVFWLIKSLKKISEFNKLFENLKIGYSWTQKIEVFVKFSYKLVEI
jgi:hypothetical protein